MKNSSRKQKQLINEIIFTAKRENISIIQISDLELASIDDLRAVYLTEAELKRINNNLEDILNRDAVIEEIIEYVKRTKIDHVDGWEDINFLDIESLRFNKTLITEELYGLLDELNKAHLADFIEAGSEPSVIDALQIIEKYKNGSPLVSVNEHKPYKLDDKWRDSIPTSLRTVHGLNWKSDSIEVVYEHAKRVMSTMARQDMAEIRTFVCDISEILHDLKQHEIEEQEEVTDKDDHSEDEIGEYIMKTLEIIILPHVEVIERYEKSGGRIQFGNLWDIPFIESLKTEVKERDKWKCVVCEGETGLHVHHKIPRALGGVHHRDNLVTLCGSCHPAIETANIRKAYSKCLANYKRNKAIKSLNTELSINKTRLKDEVIERLDYLLDALSNKNGQLANEVVEVMARLDILFNHN